MNIDDFQYDLPFDLIARYPTEQRSQSRLLVLDRDTGQIQDKHVFDIASFLQEGDLLVFNDTRVIPARFYGTKDSGGMVEVLIERIVDDHTVLAQTRAAKAPKPGKMLRLENKFDAEVLGREGDLFVLRFIGEGTALELAEKYGRLPLPPYMEREPEALDTERYQTVFARDPGAVAAPTAGLHFDTNLVDSLTAKGVDSAFVTLHVGAGTFQPLRVEDIKKHKMHSERITVPQSTADKIIAAKKNNKRVVAVGTTVMRALETVACAGQMTAFTGETDIFIYPGFEFKVVDRLVTNFHLPETTLLVLVAAFAGIDNTKAAYRHAVEQKYRFFSYGDAMLIL